MSDPNKNELDPQNRTDRAIASRIGVVRDLAEITSAGRDAFFADTPDGRMRRHAAVRLVVMFAEASKDIAVEVKRQHPEVGWTEMVRMRDKVSHKYEGVNDRIIWATITSDIPRAMTALGIAG